MSRRATRVRERSFLEEDEVSPAKAGEVVGDARADDPGAYHDCARG
jgi:hypothetical protein